MTKLDISGEKNKAKSQLSCTLPLQGYIASLRDRAARRGLKDDLMEVFGVRSAAQLWRYVTYRTGRPPLCQREEAARIVREYTDDNTITGDSLFPEEAYDKVS